MQPPTPPGNQPAITLAEKMKAWFHWLFVVLLAAAFALVLAANGLSLELPGRPGWPEALLILLATVSTITALARQLALQNVLLAASVIALMGGAVHSLGVMMGIPFGRFCSARKPDRNYSKRCRGRCVDLGHRGFEFTGVVRLILRPWRKIRSYGFWLIGLTAALTMLFDLTFDPFASRVNITGFGCRQNSR